MENQPNKEALSLTGVSFSRKEKPLVQIPPSAPAIFSFKLKWILPSGDFIANNESFYNKKHTRIMRAALNVTRQILTVI
jgi:hypothetical protein